jgi:ABC-2 type transport system ATP-binding protein
MTAIVEVDGVTRTFGETHALRGVDLDVPEGRVVALLGPNGAGKTTLVRILATLLEPSGGTARVNGFDIRTHPMAVRRSIGLAGQYAAVDGTLTGRENLEMIGRLSRLSPKDGARRADETLTRLSLHDAADRPVKTYSGGMARRLDLAAGLVATPPVLLLDEPTTGLDPRGRIELWSYLRDLVNDGSTLLLTTQYLEEADQLASEIVVIDHGAVIAHGTPLELKDQLATDVLDITVAETHALERAAAALTLVGTEKAAVDRGANRVTVPVPDGADSLVAAVRQLDDAGVTLVDNSLRRPSLDDVFLSLTGHAASDADEAADDEELAS